MFEEKINRIVSASFVLSMWMMTVTDIGHNSDWIFMFWKTNKRKQWCKKERKILEPNWLIVRLNFEIFFFFSLSFYLFVINIFSYLFSFFDIETLFFWDFLRFFDPPMLLWMELFLIINIDNQKQQQKQKRLNEKFLIEWKWLLNLKM